MGAFLGALPVVGGIIKSIFGDKAAREAADAANDAAAQSEFGAEFGLGNNRTWWDSLVNGINRIPRPFTAFAILYAVFVWPAWDMDSFIAYTQAISVVPEGFWYVAVIVISFYFGGRMQAESHSFQMTKGQMQQAAALAASQAATKAAAPKLDPMDDAAFADAMADPSPLSNQAIDEWNRRRREGR